eukprot:Gb_28258 [translate_table: standard]
MLGKRSRPVQKTSSKLHLMPDYPSDSSPTRDRPEDKHKFIHTPRLFVGFNPKGSSDSEGVRSPTSPLDIKTFSGVGITFWQEKQVRSPRSGLEGLQCGSPRPWEKRDSEGIGLGIVAALHNNNSSNTTTATTSNNNNNGTFSPKNSSSGRMLLGSQLRILVGSNHTLLSSHNHLNSPHAQLDSPKAHLKSPQPQLSSPHTHMKNSPTQLSDPYTHMKSPHDHLNSPYIQSGSPQKQSEPIPIGSPRGFVKPSPQITMEHSESYTCVTSHGPNSSTKHVYAHCVMESKASDWKREQEMWDVGSPPQSYANVQLFPTADFLSACYLCKRQLSHGKDIYMYRGDKAFCSVECRYQQILMDECMEKSSPPSSTASSHCGRIFSTSTAAAA